MIIDVIAKLDLESIDQLNDLVPEESLAVLMTFDPNSEYTVTLKVDVSEGFEILSVDRQPVVASQDLYLVNGVIQR